MENNSWRNVELFQKAMKHMWLKAVHDWYNVAIDNTGRVTDNEPEPFFTFNSSRGEAFFVDVHVMICCQGFFQDFVRDGPNQGS